MLGNRLQWNSNHNEKKCIHKNTFESVLCKMESIMSRGNELKYTPNRDISSSTLLAGDKNSQCDAFNEISAVPLSASVNILTLKALLPDLASHLKIMLAIQKWWNIMYRADSRFALSQWEMTLLCNNVSHWLGAKLVLPIMHKMC